MGEGVAREHRLRELVRVNVWENGWLAHEGNRVGGGGEEEEEATTEASKWSCMILELSWTAAIRPPKGAATTMRVDGSRGPMQEGNGELESARRGSRTMEELSLS
jgi:hypothetical protein